MRFGLALPHSGSLASAQNIKEIAIEAEDLGYDSLWVHDHITYDVDWVEHRTSGLPASGGSWQPNFFEALATLAFVAGITNKVELGTAVLVLPLRDPRVVARQAMTLQALSGGRLLLGIGTGDYPSDFRVMEVPFGNRGSLTDEHLAALRAIFPGGTSSFAGETICFEAGTFLPLVAPIPILVGGGIIRSKGGDYRIADPALRRVAHWGDGWIPEGPPDVVAAGIERVGQLAHEYNRGQTDWIVWVASPLYIGDATDSQAALESSRDVGLIGSVNAIARKVGLYERAGASGITVRCWAEDVQSFLAMIRKFAREVAPQFR